MYWKALALERVTIGSIVISFLVKIVIIVWLGGEEEGVGKATSEWECLGGKREGNWRERGWLPNLCSIARAC